MILWYYIGITAFRQVLQIGGWSCFFNSPDIECSFQLDVRLETLKYCVGKMTIRRINIANIDRYYYYFYRCG